MTVPFVLIPTNTNLQVIHIIRICTAGDPAQIDPSVWEYHFLYELHRLHYFGGIGEERKGLFLKAGDTSRRMHNDAAEEMLLFRSQNLNKMVMFCSIK